MELAVRIWKKQEKRIVRLLYRKGLLSDFKLSELYWNEYHPLRCTKRKHGRKYRHTIYAPEVHYSTTDYYGECDEHPIVGHVLDMLYWKYAELQPDQCDGDWPKSTFIYKGRLWFIRYLESLPTIKNDCKINKVLVFNSNP